MQRPLSGPPPRLKAPAGTCDTHMHFYGAACTAIPTDHRRRPMPRSPNTAN